MASISHFSSTPKEWVDPTAGIPSPSRCSSIYGSAPTKKKALGGGVQPNARPSHRLIFVPSSLPNFPSRTPWHRCDAPFQPLQFWIPKRRREKQIFLKKKRTNNKRRGKRKKRKARLTANRAPKRAPRAWPGAEIRTTKPKGKSLATIGAADARGFALSRRRLDFFLGDLPRIHGRMEPIPTFLGLPKTIFCSARSRDDPPPIFVGLIFVCLKENCGVEGRR